MGNNDKVSLRGSFQEAFVGREGTGGHRVGHTQRRRVSDGELKIRTETAIQNYSHEDNRKEMKQVEVSGGPQTLENNI